MTRRSTIIALLAIVVSLLVHMLGLSFSPGVKRDSQGGDKVTDVVEVNNAFEDVAEAVSEPVTPEPTPSPEPELPEPAPEPEPVEETVPEPEPAEAPTSEVLVGSPNPQNTPVPDTGATHDEAGTVLPTIGVIIEF